MKPPNITAKINAFRTFKSKSKCLNKTDILTGIKEHTVESKFQDPSTLT